MVVTALCALSLLAYRARRSRWWRHRFLWPVLRRVTRSAVDGATVAAAGLVVVALFAWVAYQALRRSAERALGARAPWRRRDGLRSWRSRRANVERTLAEQVRVRTANLGSQLGNPLAGVWPGSVARGQTEQFFRHGASLGVLLVGLALTLAPPRAGTPDDIVRRLTVVALVALSWSLLVFGPGQALIHHGSPVTTALLFFAGGYGLTRLLQAVAWTCSPPWGAGLVHLVPACLARPVERRLKL